MNRFLGTLRLKRMVQNKEQCVFRRYSIYSLVRFTYGWSGVFLTLLDMLAACYRRIVGF